MKLDAYCILCSIQMKLNARQNLEFVFNSVVIKKK